MAWKKIVAGDAKLEYLKDANSFKKFDSYMLWGDLTYFHKLPTKGPGKSVSPLPVIFEADLSDPKNLESLKEVIGLSTLNTEKGTQTHTGFVKPVDLVIFSSRVDRFRIGSVSASSTKSFKLERGNPIVLKRPKGTGSPEVVVGIIDHGIAFAHKGFCTSNESTNRRTETRIEHFWDQQRGYPASPPRVNHSNYRWKPVKGFGYGRELEDTDINTLMRDQPDEMRIYKEQNYRPVQSAISHGTHVLGIAAGEQRFYDIAAHTKIIAVQMPALPYKNTSGESLCVHVLDAVRYILHHANGRMVVINLSDGAYAGPHDGTSLLETAIANQFSQHNEPLAFVVAAGNQFDERVHWQAKIAKNEAHNVELRILPDDKTDSHVEIWFDAGTNDEALKAVKVEVSLPGSKDKLATGVEETAIFESGEQVVACVMFRGNAVNSKRRAMIHIALAPTVNHQVQHGICNIALTHSFDGEISINAYVERDNPALGDKGPRRQPHFIHPSYPKACNAPQPCVDDADNPSPIRRFGALNSIATAGNVLVVGGYVEKTRQIACYSASGPGRASGPLAVTGVDLLAPADATRLLKGVRSFGNRSGTTFRMNGTSVAAPLAMRKIANLMSPAMSMSQVFDALKAEASNAKPVLRPAERVGVGRIRPYPDDLY